MTEQGKIFIVDRKKVTRHNQLCFSPRTPLTPGLFSLNPQELIKVKGNQVAPTELEGVLLEHPSVADAAVIGITR